MSSRVALVTGAANGLGRAYAERLSASGYRIAAFDRIFDEDPLPFESCQVVDVADLSAVEEAVSVVVSQFGRVDVLICNAGGGGGAMNDNKPSEIDMDLFMSVLGVNLFGTVHCVKAVVPIMKRQGSGSIITVSSEAGLLPSVDGGYSHYGVSKAAVAMYTRYLARELGTTGIRANCIAPGPVGTARLMKRFSQTGVDQVASRYTLRRLGRVEDLVAMVELLADDTQSAWTTGQVISINGGGPEHWVG